jgi:biotin-dependent carboxylase-like uncharacterized protein
VSQQTGFSVEEIIRRHSQREYQVYAVGFVPGQPMMGTLDPALYLPRRSTPRKRIEPNTVAMAVSQTCIYVLPTPGGWHLLGTSLEAVYDPQREKPFLLEAGEMVRFKPSQGPTPEYAKALQTLPSEPEFPALRVEEPGLLDLTVDQGRFMAARFGMARSGPLDERSASIANRAVGNRGNESLLELTLKGPVLSVLRNCVIAFAGFGMECYLDGVKFPLAEGVAVKVGQKISFKPTSIGVRAYLAVAGGFAVKPFMGSRSSDIQGLIGRALKAGDILGIAKPRTVLPGFSAQLVQLPATVQIRLQPGPQANKEALDALASAPFTVTSPNRMGVQLQGPKVPGGELVSEATPMGAVQITIDGNPIVLLNDRGRIGGYQKPAIVDPRDLPLVAQLRPGQKIRFVRPASSSAEHWFIQV